MKKMKKLVALLLIILVILPGCTSKAEKELQRARETANTLRKAAQEAKDDYERLIQDFEDYNRQVDRIQNAD